MNDNQTTNQSEDLDNSLVRWTGNKDQHPRDFKPKRVILIGSGAVKESWEPLLRLLKQKPPIDMDDSVSSQLFGPIELASHVLANQSFMFRSIRSLLIRRISNGDLKSETFSHCKTSIERFNEFRLNLGTYYSKAVEDKDISLRKEVESIKNLLCPDTGVITTNWDELFWQQKELFPNLIQLHGRATLPKSLIFPTELTLDEELIAQIDFNRLTSKFLEGALSLKEPEKWFREMLSREAYFVNLKMAHDTAVHWLSDAEEVVIWGLAFNVYDAELNSIVSVSNHPKQPTKSISVFDTNKEIAIRIAALMAFPFENLTFHQVT